MKLLRALLISAAIPVCLASASCSHSEVVSPASALRSVANVEGADRASLLAWKETLGSAYPLTIRGRDTVAALLRLVNLENAAWNSGSVAGIPMFATVYSGEQTVGEYGFIETSHGQGGYFVARVNQALVTRPASADDIARFLGFFSVGQVVVQ